VASVNKQAIQEEPIIVFFEEARVSIIATLNNMTWCALVPCRYILGYLGIGISFSCINIVFLSLYNIFIIERGSHEPPIPLTCIINGTQKYHLNFVISYYFLVMS
jgi:hypothetical protein